jgi:microcystin-dependent protein
MSDPFLGEVKIVGFYFAPRGWAKCDGQLLPINQNQALFSLLGTQFGGNGQTTFALPDLRGRVPMHAGFGPIMIGEVSGLESVTLRTEEMPLHGHARGSTLQATSTTASLNVPAGQPRRGVARYTYEGAPVVLNGSASVGGQPHNNMQPSLTLNFVIALQGIYPSRN